MHNCVHHTYTKNETTKHNDNESYRHTHSNKVTRVLGFSLRLENECYQYQAGENENEGCSKATR